MARAEGEAIAATVSEAATGAYLDWSAQTGGDRSAEEFFDAASRGRRFRSGPTPSVAALALARHPEALAYATALSEVCTAAATLGTPDAAGDGQRLDRRGRPAGRRTSLADARRLPAT